MDKNGVITIGNWQKGIATSPYLGFADVRNCEIHYPEGVLKIALAPTKISSTTVTGLPTWMTSDKVSSYFFGGYQDTNVYTFQNNSTVGLLPSTGAYTGSGTGGGMYYKNKLVISTISNSVDHLIALQAGFWQPVGDLTNFSAGDVTPFYWAQDDSLYIASGRNVDKLTVTTDSWDVLIPANFTYSPNVLDIYGTYKIDAITEIGVNLYFGASRRPSGSVIQESYDGKIFPWNTTDPTFKLPIILDRGGVKQMISRNGTVMLASGRKGKFVLTNGSATQDVQEIGLLTNNPPNTFFDIYPQACDFVNGEYLFGISSSNTSYTPAGVYGFKNNTWRFLEISTGSTGDSSEVAIGVIYKKDDTNFYVGWKDGTTYGVDEFGANGYRYTGYRAYVDSQLYQVGTVLKPRQLQKLEFSLARPLAEGQGIQFLYRFDLHSAWQVFSTYDFATYGGITQFEDKCLIPACNNLQVRVALTTGVNSTTSPELINVRLS